MTKLEWCRANASPAIQQLSDAEVLDYMSSTYDKFCVDKEEITDDLTHTEHNPINDKMDIMVKILCSYFGDRLAFKGGYMLTKLMPETARQTTDIDFSIQNSELYQELISVMRRIGDEFIERGFIASYTVKDVLEKYRSGGMDMFDADGGKVLGIDIGWHDITFGTTTTTIDIGAINAFTVERMLADKITAILSRKRFRRPKDIYDLYCITNCFDFDVNTVNDYILKRTEGAGADWKNFPFDMVVIQEYEKAYNKLALNSILKGVVLERPSFGDVLARFNTICRRLLNPENKYYWDHTETIFKSVKKEV